MEGIIRTVGDLYFKQEYIRNTRYLPREMQAPVTYALSNASASISSVSPISSPTPLTPFLIIRDLRPNPI